MHLDVIFFAVVVIFMTALSILYAYDRKTIVRAVKGSSFLWIPITVLAVCLNLVVGIMVSVIFLKDSDVFAGFSGNSLLFLSYQEICDLSLVLLAMCAGSVLIGKLLCAVRPGNPQHKRNRNIGFLCVFSFLVLQICLLFFVGIQGREHLIISEFYLPDKNTTLHELDSYLELANDGILSYNTEGLYLSDDQNTLKKMQVKATRISPKGTMLIPLDENVFSFGRSGGDSLILSDENGNIIDAVITGDTRENKSYTRRYADRQWVYRNPTPGAYNLEKPQFSDAAGFYNGAFYVTLSAQKGADIYYTWDGSTPTVESEKYDGKILIYDRSEESNVYRSVQNVTRLWLENTVDTTPVPKATVIRAIAVNPDGTVSEVATATYFVNQKDLEDKFVVSLVADPDDLFGPQGIYSTGEAYDQWYLNGQIGDAPEPNFEIHGLECSGNVELFQVTDQGYLSQRCGIRIQGGSHRNVPVKNMSIFSREEYSGSEFFDQNLFGTGKTHSVALRDGFNNAFTMELVPDRNVAYQTSVPVAVYLNGEYWYDTYLQEKYNDEFFEEHYHLEDVAFAKVGVTEEMLRFVQENDMQTEAAYHKLNAFVDIQSYIDFMCANIYLANTDYAEATSGGNSAIWRSQKIENSGYGDGRWRWALYDMDLITDYCRWELGLLDITDAQLNTFNITRTWTKPLEERPFYSSLKKNPLFREQFVLTFMDMANTCFAPDFVETVLTKWGQDLNYNSGFYLERKEYITKYLADAYDLTGTQEELSVQISDPDAGWVQVNTCKPNLDNGIWSGTYFTDYPITITAEAKNGYRFVGWDGDLQTESPEISFILPEGGISVRAIYEAYEK